MPYIPYPTLVKSVFKVNHPVAWQGRKWAARSWSEVLNPPVTRTSTSIHQIPRWAEFPCGEVVKFEDECVKETAGGPLYSFISNMKVSDLLKRSRNLLDLAECHLNMSRLFLARSLKIGDAQAVYPGWRIGFPHGPVDQPGLLGVDFHGSWGMDGRWWVMVLHQLSSFSFHVLCNNDWHILKYCNIFLEARWS